MGVSELPLDAIPVGNADGVQLLEPRKQTFCRCGVETKPLVFSNNLALAGHVMLAVGDVLPRLLKTLN